MFVILPQFPLTSKSGKLLKMVQRSGDNKQDSEQFILHNCPGGPAGFLLAAKFCYGVRLDHYKPEEIINVHCVADYLQMTEDYSSQNLLSTSHRYFHTHIARSWRRCVSALQSVGIDESDERVSVSLVEECLNALSKMIRANSSSVKGKLHTPRGSILWNGIPTGARIPQSATESGWWFHDASRLSFPLFERLVGVIEKKDAVPSEELADGVIYYAKRHIPGINRRGSKKATSPSSSSCDQKDLVEGVQRLFPVGVKGKTYCGFLLGLLRLSMILNASTSCKNSLVTRIGSQLEFATLDGLLIPSFFPSSSGSDVLYNTDCVESIFRCVNHDMTIQFDYDDSAHSTAKLVDSFLAEVAPDVNLRPEKMQSLAMALPRDLRTCEDGIYRALDIYFIAHPWISEKEREDLCCILDYEKLSVEAFAHASQNERLPIRVVVQILFFDQLRLRRTVNSRLEFDGRSRSSSDSGSRISSVMKADIEAMRIKIVGLEQEMAGMKQSLSRSSPDVQYRSRRRSVHNQLGCTPRSSNCKYQQNKTDR